MPATRQLAKLIVSWLTAAAGILTGFCYLVISGRTWFPMDTTEPHSLAEWVSVAGPGLCALVFFIASFVALRKREVAGLLFLVCAPIVGFCLAYPKASIWEGNSIYTLAFSPALSLGVLFYLPFCVPLVRIRNRRHAVYLFLILAGAAGFLLSMSKWSAVLLPPLAAWTAVFVAFGSFWLGTGRLSWPPHLTSEPRPLGRRLATIFIGCLLVAMLDVAVTLALTARQSSLWHGDGVFTRLFVGPLHPDHAVFTARVLIVGHVKRDPSSTRGEWAIGVVYERFWGLPSWAPLVLLTDGIFSDGETYFIDGRRNRESLLTRFLPIVRAGPYRSKPLADAIIDMRLLHHPPPTGGACVIGYVLEPRRSGGALQLFRFHTPRAGARVSVRGSSGTTIVTTDQNGIYEVDGLPPDHYAISVLDVPDTQYGVERPLEKDWLTRSKLFEVNLFLDYRRNPSGGN